MAYFVGTSTSTYPAPNYEGLLDRIRFKLCADVTQNTYTSPITGLMTSPDPPNNGMMPVGQTWTEVACSNPWSPVANQQEIKWTILHKTRNLTIHLY